jgi:large subunit ribosomal protein L30
MADTITFTLVKSGIGSTRKIRATLTGLGLTRMQKTVTRKDTPEIRGMLAKVAHLVRVEEAQ